MNLCSPADVERIRMQGWRVLSDSALKSWKKEDLIEYIRCLEHNWAGTLMSCDILTKRLEKCYDYYKNQGITTKEFNEIIKLDCEMR